MRTELTSEWLKTCPSWKFNTFLGTELKFNIEENIEFTKFVSAEERESIPQYLKIGLEYMEWAFLSIEERFAKEKEELIVEHRLQEIQEWNLLTKEMI